MKRITIICFALSCLFVGNSEAQVLRGRRVDLTQSSGFLYQISPPTLSADKTLTLPLPALGLWHSDASGVITSSLVSLTADVSGTLPIGNGGTNATTANASLNNLLPSQSSNANKFLQTDGTNTSWATANGTGTVTSVSVTTSQGISGTVATATTTPAITVAATGRLIRAPQVLTSGTSYTTPAGCNTISVECVGGGGGGGGAGTAGTSAAAPGGGGYGAYASKTFAVSPSTAYTYAIGAAGAAGNSTPGNGGNGGSTTFTVGGTTVTAPGGTGSILQAAGTAVKFGAGGAGGAISTNGDINLTGTIGDNGIRLSGTVSASGNGASGFYGSGGAGSNVAGAGSAGTGYGAGGSGGSVVNGSAAVAGGAGSAGVIIVSEYY